MVSKQDIGSKLIVSEEQRKLWSFPEGEIKIILSTLTAKTEEGYGHATGMGEVYALEELIPIIKSLYASVSVHFSEEIAFEQYKNHNLILIGGPLANKITSTVMEKAESKLRFNERYQLISEELKDTFEFIKEGSHAVDYGVILKKPNPFNKTKMIVVIAGCRTFGTHYAALTLSAKETAVAITDLYDTKSFEVLIKIENPEVVPKDPLTILLPKELQHIKLWDSLESERSISWFHQVGKRLFPVRSAILGLGPLATAVFSYLFFLPKPSQIAWYINQLLGVATFASVALVFTAVIALFESKVRKK